MFIITPTYNMGHAEAISQKLPHSHKKVLCKSFTYQLSVNLFFFYIYIYICAIFDTQTNTKCETVNFIEKK